MHAARRYQVVSTTMQTKPRFNNYNLTLASVKLRINRNHRRVQDFTMKWVRVVEVSGTSVPQKLKQNVKLVYIFNVFLHKILDFMNLSEGLGEYILQTRDTKKFWRFNGAFEPPKPFPLWVRQW